MQMLANRDKDGKEDPEPTRRTPAQLIDGYVDINRWAKEYLRTRFGLEYFQVGDNVPDVRPLIVATASTNLQFSATHNHHEQLL